MSAPATPLKLVRGDRQRLEATVRKSTATQRDVKRARVVLLAAEGRANAQIADDVGIQRTRVLEWRRRYEQDGLAGLADLSGRGRKRKYTDAQTQKVLHKVCRKPPKGLTRWSVRSLSRAVGMPKSVVHLILKDYDLHPHRLRTFNFSPDPRFEEKLLDVVGLYMSPPENAIVLCVDEKTGIQALDRTQPLLPLKAGKPRAWSNEYVRHGTQTLLAALDVGNGEVTAWVNKTRKTKDFITFMDMIVDAYPGERLCVVLDNLNTHTGKAAQQWLAENHQVSFHYTPTHASWVNLIECFFSILTRQGLQQAVHRSAKELTKFLYEFIELYNENCGPFIWTKGPKKLQRIIQLTHDFQQTQLYSH